jgi:hypothetical protein
MEPDGYCTVCHEPMSFEAAIFSDCAEVLCESCYQSHECSECFPEEDDSDSTYELSEDPSSTEQETESQTSSLSHVEEEDSSQEEDSDD